MTVYIEDSIIENLFVTLFLLLCLNKIFNLKPKKIRLLGVSLLAGFIATFYPLLNFNGLVLILFKLCAGVVIVYAYSGKQQMLAKYVAFMLLTTLYAGANIFVYYIAYGTLNVTNNFATHVLIIMLYVVYYLFNSCLKLLKKNLTISNFVYTIKITNNNKQHIDTAFLDSGNTLIDSKDGEPIFVINFKLFNKLYGNVGLEDILAKNFKNLKDPHYVKSNFASGSAKILVFTVEQMEIMLASKPIQIQNARLGLVYSKFNKNFNCNMLLNINAFCQTN